VGQYLGKTLTIVNPRIVNNETSISEFNGFSAVLTAYVDDEYPELEIEYGLPTSDAWGFKFWLITENNIERLLEQKAITIS